MPTDWDPCPGKINANGFMRRPSKIQNNRAPGETTSNAFKQQGLTGLDFSISHTVI
jgi:hypothetical protein